jgi:hypothetical protein
MQVKWTATALLLCLSALACTRATRTPEAQPAAAQAPALSHGRIVAIGDLHGDLDVTRRALRLVGAIGADDHWSGEKLTLVQTGDAIDRGDSDREVLDLLERLRGEASRAGGSFIALSGNHEIMNVSGDFRYVSPKSAAAFCDRRQAFAPGGPYARLLASWPVIAKVADSIFVHGGVLPHHVQYGIDAINREAAAWMRGDGPVPAILMRDDAPVWTRLYSSDPTSEACAQLEEVLRSAGAARMVVGHTPQTRGVSAACGEQVWRIDTGMSHFYGGPVQVLELESGRVRVRAE